MTRRSLFRTLLAALAWPWMSRLLADEPPPEHLIPPCKPKKPNTHCVAVRWKAETERIYKVTMEFSDGWQWENYATTFDSMFGSSLLGKSPEGVYAAWKRLCWNRMDAESKARLRKVYA